MRATVAQCTYTPAARSIAAAAVAAIRKSGNPLQGRARGLHWLGYEARWPSIRASAEGCASPASGSPHQLSRSLSLSLYTRYSLCAVYTHTHIRTPRTAPSLAHPQSLDLFLFSPFFFSARSNPPAATRLFLLLLMPSPSALFLYSSTLVILFYYIYFPFR